MEMIELWNGQTIPRLGLGCWAIGGPFAAGDQPLGWGEVDDRESIAAIHRAVDKGVRLFDTANVYGAGHSEEVLGEALSGISEEIIVTTKFGNDFDPATRQVTGEIDDPASITKAIEGSLKRLRRERLDLVFLHINELPIQRAEVVFDTLSRLREAGKIDAFGWSTDDVARAKHFAGLEGYAAIQFDMNLLKPAHEMVSMINGNGLTGFIRQPLAMGLLSGRFKAGGTPFSASDIRSQSPDWQAYFIDGAPNSAMLDIVEQHRPELTSNGRSMVQGALHWLWTQSPSILPIPGFRTVKQVEDLTGLLDQAQPS